MRITDSLKKKKKEVVVEEPEEDHIDESEEELDEDDVEKSETGDVESGSNDEQDMEHEDNESIEDAGVDSDVGEEEVEFEHPEEKQKKSGVLYFPNIPPRYNPTRLKAYFERLAPGMIGRVYFERNKNSKSIESRYLEGWLEIKRKKLAKQLAARVDNTEIGGKKRDYVSSMLWNIKYLSGFKWVHLVEQLEYEKAIEGKRMIAEVSQARRVAAHFEEQVEKGEQLKKLEEKVLRQGGKWDTFQRQITQKQSFKKKRKRGNNAKDDDVMKMIFAE